ncbi:LapA family protein [Antribacter sp. KLBMP9083]|uniref:LapA family protein n=1 Tax=Antribacter soli TaxID=2910976 RepID=A0AA41UA90_9MICO|nr:LapA family protein [Antribacter soli]MCF4119909.1 LapA family protein [Antribacter soli]
MATDPIGSTTNGDPGAAGSGPDAVRRATRSARRPPRATRTRAGAAWVGVCIAALLLIALIIFMLQNTQRVLVSFLGMQGSVPLALALLIAGIGVGVVALVIGTVRISQLRRRISHSS